MDILANVKEYANENDDAKIIGQETKQDGSPNLMIGEHDGLLHNKVAMNDGELVYISGGNGGRPTPPNFSEDENVAIEKPKDRRKLKRTATAS